MYFGFRFNLQVLRTLHIFPFLPYKVDEQGMLQKGSLFPHLLVQLLLAIAQNHTTQAVFSQVPLLTKDTIRQLALLHLQVLIRLASTSIMLLYPLLI